MNTSHDVDGLILIIQIIFNYLLIHFCNMSVMYIIKVLYITHTAKIHMLSCIKGIKGIHMNVLECELMFINTLLKPLQCCDRFITKI